MCLNTFPYVCSNCYENFPKIAILTSTFTFRPETASTGISHADDVPRPDSGLGKTKTSTTSIHLGLKQAKKDSDKPKPTSSPDNLSVDNTTDVSSPSDRHKLSLLPSPYIFTQTSSGGNQIYTLCYFH